MAWYADYPGGSRCIVLMQLTQIRWRLPLIRRRCRLSCWCRTVAMLEWLRELPRKARRPQRAQTFAIVT